ncbi:hypothetical protein MPRM_49570 [Mycobacterium parmense]|uniref:Uncharacterized protein n=1 Tax=Mycobacterium parmense TaxID=185642 RepID=A0A7I7Z0S1_9MYCO|nr:hypothetical protein MPRM_49570 [Mycobacterium parmense]
MALIAEDPPMPRPRTSRIDDPVADCTVVESPQSAELPIMVGHNGGTALAGNGVALPASSSNTRALGSSESRLAITDPAVPAPTTMKS